MQLVHQDRLISLATPLGKDVLFVETLEGSEGMSRLFRFQVVLVSEKADIPLSALVGQSVTITYELAGGKERYLNGFVSRFAQGDVDRRVSHYNMEVVPWLWFLTRTTDCRIFQRKTVPEIIQQIFRDLSFTDFRLQLQGNFEPREYCVQYRESDFNFVSRLMEEEGIFYFFEHSNGKHTLVVANDPSVHQVCPDQPQARYTYTVGGKSRTDSISRWHIEQEFEPGKYTLADYYFETPNNNLMVSTPTSLPSATNGKFELYDYPGYYAKRFDGDDKAPKVRPDGERTSKLGMQGAEAFYKVVNGASDCRAFVPGYKFDFTEHRRAELNGPYVLTEVSHAATNNLGSGEGCSYDNTFTCIPLAVPFRPGRTAAKPVVHGSQTAVVVGSPGEEIHTDKYGRVKVQFHWDREGKKDHNSSCWVRVAQPWAGKGFGMVHIPRVGQEVVVQFLEGDPDQPIVVGSVYNGEQTPPYSLPASKMVMGIKSNSTPGGGGHNEIILDDTKGKEQIRIHGQYNMDTTVLHDQTSAVHNNRTDNVKVDDSETVGGKQSLEVGKSRTVKVGTDQEVKIGANLTSRIGSDEKREVTGNQQTTVGIEQQLKVGAAQTVTVGAARKVKVAAKDELIVSGAQTINVTGAIEIVSEASITLTVKGSSITIEPDTITLHSKNIKIGGDSKVEVKGGVIVSEADGDHEVKGATVKLN